MIAGPEGEEIHTDRYGRVKLWFPWDRRAKKDGSDTRWVRVAQPWAGGAWGTQVIPRIGMEAVVSFEGGDPDRPIVTALVPNPQNAVPYELPLNKSRMVMRSDTYKGIGYNEMSFEDENGGEEIYVRAQRDLNMDTLNHRSELTQGNFSAQVNGKYSLHTLSGYHMEVGRSVQITVGAIRADSYLRNMRFTSDDFKAAGYRADAQHWTNHAAEGSFDIAASGTVSMSGNSNLQMRSGRDANIFSGASILVRAIERITHTARKTISFASGANVVVNAAKLIRIANAISQIKIEENGDIDIRGKNITITADGNFKVKADRVDLN